MKSTPKPKPGTLRERALGYLARREHSRFELTRKLELAEFSLDEIGPLLDEFEEKKWLSDVRFAESWVADHQAKAGRIKLAFELRQRGVSDSVIEDVLREHRDSELDRALEAWRKKSSVAPADRIDKAHQIRFLQSRGFTPEVIHRAIRGRNNSK